MNTRFSGDMHAVNHAQVLAAEGVQWQSRLAVLTNDMLVAMTTLLDFKALRLHPFIGKIEKSAITVTGVFVD